MSLTKTTTVLPATVMKKHSVRTSYDWDRYLSISFSQFVAQFRVVDGSVRKGDLWCAPESAFIGGRAREAMCTSPVFTVLWKLHIPHQWCMFGTCPKARGSSEIQTLAPTRYKLQRPRSPEMPSVCGFKNDYAKWMHHQRYALEMWSTIWCLKIESENA